MKRNGGDKRGSSRDRRQRKLYMLGALENAPSPFAGADGTHVDCVHCGIQLDYQTLEADRIRPGGSYWRGNIQPSCGPCNKARGNDLVTWAKIQETTTIEAAIASVYAT